MKKYRTITLQNFKKEPLVKQHLSDQQIQDIEIVGTVLPFKTNNYVVEELIKWEAYENDPIYILNFPQKRMLSEEHYSQMVEVWNSGNKENIIRKAQEIRAQLNPNPAGQADHNVPMLNGEKLNGVQHKYRETMLVFPSQGQTCHAYCTFCFRWSQFVQIEDGVKFATKEADKIVGYLQEHPEISDILFTGGDPMVMPYKFIEAYFETIMNANIPHLKTIRIGSKSLAYWPYKYTEDKDADKLLALFKKVIDSGLHISFMAHFNHWQELTTDAVKQAIQNLRGTGIQIRTQSPLLNNINASSDVWAKMWKMQVALGLIPYYMFIARDTGAQEYFAVSLIDAWKIFKGAYSQVSGIARTVKGPSMSADPGKVMMNGVVEINGEKHMMLTFLQGRNPEWVYRPFFAKYDEKAIWLSDLKPSFEDEFFYRKEWNPETGFVKQPEMVHA